MDEDLDSKRKDHEDGVLKELMVLYQAGNAQAADQLIRLLNRNIASYLYATSMASPNYDDVLQECWLRIHKARSSYRPGEAVLPWVLAICRHVRIDYYRKWLRTSGRETEFLEASNESTGKPQNSLDEAIDANWVRRLLRTLPESQREVIVMLKFSGMSIQEVALATGSTPAAIKQKAHRAYQSLRAVLGVGSRSERMALRLGASPEANDGLS